MEDFGVSAADLASVNVDSILALRLTSPEQPILMFCAKPERDAYLVVARLAFDRSPVSVARNTAQPGCRTAYFRSLVSSSMSRKMTSL